MVDCPDLAVAVDRLHGIGIDQFDRAGQRCEVVGQQPRHRGQSGQVARAAIDREPPLDLCLHSRGVDPIDQSGVFIRPIHAPV